MQRLCRCCKFPSRPRTSNCVQIHFTAQPNTGYAIEYRDSLQSGVWQTLVVVDPIASLHTVTFADPLASGRPTRFYRIKVNQPQAIRMPPSKPAGREASHYWQDTEDDCESPKAPAPQGPGIKSRWATNDEGEKCPKARDRQPAVRLPVEAVDSTEYKSCAHSDAGHTPERNRKPAEYIGRQLPILGSSEHTTTT